ncbi:putative leucine-rich repeat-containing protein DDB_G0290503 isoform X2 [Clytia hemisphaerica]|uniref:putative leucine-rich repeat-containing protein DDB_G0290503 isoform X2 n=1 Tax=Clytia hemisphaerica TaxID=252671 RepID=UPI0034D39714
MYEGNELYEADVFQTYSEDSSDKMLNGLNESNDIEFGDVKTWTTMDTDEWSHLNKTAQNANDLLQTLEENVSQGFDELASKISEIEKDDLTKTQKLLENFKTRWNAKHKETENLRLSLKRLSHESTRINEDYHELESSITSMRKQFGQAIDSSVTEIEELSLCNSSLSKRIHELESKILRGDKSFKKNTKEQLDSLYQIVDFCSSDDVTVQSVQKKLKKEADKIDRMLIVEDLFAVTEEEGSTLVDKSQEMVTTLAQGLAETLKHELQESRIIVDHQRKRIKDLEKEKEEFLENQLKMKNEGVSEMNEIVEHLRRSLVRNVNNTNEGESNRKMVDRNFTNIRKTLRTISDGLDRSYKTVVSKSNEVSELKETIKEMGEQVHDHTLTIEELQGEKQFLKSRIDHAESQHRITNDELNAVQKRLTIAEKERKVFHDENTHLKGGKANMQDFCSSLSGENEKLGSKLKLVQEERDGLFHELQEQIHKTADVTSENNELETKLEALESVITKLRREYQDQTREVNILTRESEDLRHSLQDSEQDCMKLRRSMKATETGNKDLEDQIFQVTNDFQKLKLDNEKFRLCQREQQQTIEELRESIEFGSNEKDAIESELKEVFQQQKQLQEANKTLSNEIDRDKSMTEKRKTLLILFEKLLMKLLHQRKQLMSLAKVELTNENALQLCSTQSIEYKNVQDLKQNVDVTDKEIENSYTNLTDSLSTRISDINRYETFLNDIIEYSKQCSSIKDDQSDSCYSTDDLTEPHVPRRDVSGGLRGLSALKAKYRSEFSRETLERLSEKLKRSLSEPEIDCTDSNPATSIIAKRKIMNKKISQLHTKLRNRKTIERNLQNKLSHVKKENKVLKEFHRMHHLKRAVSIDQLAQRGRTPPKSANTSPRSLGINVTDLQTELAEAHKELQGLRDLLEKHENHECKRVVNVHLEPINKRMTSLKEKLELRVNCALCTKKDTETSVDNLENKVSQISEQREYMLEHMKFTNRRLEVLLNALKGRGEEQPKNDSNNNTPATKSLSPSPRAAILNKHTTPEKTVTMQKAVSILELTKAISINDLQSLDEASAIDEEQRDVIVLVKDMNDNMETVLREARSKITEARISKKSLEMKTELVDGRFVLEVVPKSQLLKKENELKTSLEKAQKKLDDLASYLEKREAELKERDEIIAKLNKEYDELKSQTTDQSDSAILTRDRMIDEYRTTIEKLEKENDFLQVVVKELRMELNNLHKSLKKEEETQQHQQEFINELNICKASLEKSLDKVAYELNIVKTDRDHLMQTMNSVHLVPSAAYWYNAGIHNLPNGAGLPIGMPPPNGAGYQSGMPHCHDGSYYDGCDVCAYQDFSEQSTALPFSEEDWASLCDDCESFPSDAEGPEGAEGECVSSSESQKTTTSSRVAKKIKTGEAVRVKKRYAKETRTRKQMLSPKMSAKQDPVEGVSLVNTEPRVQGRRELGNPWHNPHHQHQHQRHLETHGRRSSLESNSTVQRPSSRQSPRPASRSSRPNSVHYESIDFQPSPVTDISDAVSNAAHAQQNYYDERNMVASPRDDLVAPFLNQNFEKKKKRRSFNLKKPFSKK